MGWIGCAVQQVTSKRLPGFFFRFNILIFIYFFKYKTIETHARAFFPLHISDVGSVLSEIEYFLLFRAKYQEIGLLGWLQRGFEDTIMIHGNDIGRVDLSPDYLTLCNRYFISETSLRTETLGENNFGVASYFFYKVGTF